MKTKCKPLLAASSLFCGCKYWPLWEVKVRPRYFFLSNCWICPNKETDSRCLNTMSIVYFADCTLQQFMNGQMYDSNFDISDLEASYPVGQQLKVNCKIGYSGFFKLICTNIGWKHIGKKCEREFELFLFGRNIINCVALWFKILNCIYRVSFFLHLSQALWPSWWGSLCRLCSGISRRFCFRVKSRIHMPQWVW